MNTGENTHRDRQRRHASGHGLTAQVAFIESGVPRAEDVEILRLEAERAVFVSRRPLEKGLNIGLVIKGITRGMFDSFGSRDRLPETASMLKTQAIVEDAGPDPERAGRFVNIVQFMGNMRISDLPRES
jgi:hypothetical protein